MDLTKINVRAIPHEVKEWCDAHSVSTTTTFCAWYEYIDGEIVERCFATRVKKKEVRITEVLRAETGSNSVIVKNLYSTYMSGYNAVYTAEDVIAKCGGYPITVFSKSEFDRWEDTDGRCGFSYISINPDMIFTIPEFKYCGYSGGCGVISYIKAWRKDKHIEFFGKMGLPLSPVLINKAKADGKFRRFLWENHNGVALYGVQAALYAYKHNITCEEARRICNVKNQLDRLVAHRIPASVGTKIDRQRLLDYVDENNIDYTLYNDYLVALKALKYDLKDTKNIYPRDFKAMHDLRAAEYASFKVKEDAKKRAKLYRDFRRVAKGYIGLETKGEKYCLIVPRDISELITEGEVLSHCVGRMGYDKKMVDGVSLIIFCRENAAPGTPFATVEYDLKNNKVRQFYARGNTAPPQDAVSFVSMWAKKVKDTRKERAAI